jgi:hypothetical protein
VRVDRYKNFLSLEECNILNEWVDKAISNKWMNLGFNTQKRYTTRQYGSRFEYPQIVLDISKRIRSFCGVDSYPLIEGHGLDGVVVSCIFGESDVYKHKDSPSKEGLATLRCNVMTRKSDGGGILYLDEQLIDVEVGELHCYLASDFEHYVTEVQGETGRVLWMFGAHVPFEDWESGKIKFNNPIV